MSGRLHYSRDVSFVSLQSAVFCVQCELICENSTRFCLACGSQALLSLSRALGGSLRDQQTAHLIADAELDRLVRELLHTVPSPQPVSQSMFADRRILREGPDPSSPIASLSGRHHLRALRKGDEIVCRARTGRTAPDLGVRLQTNSGLSAESVRTGEVLLCDDAETDPFVDLASCRRLGVRSILVAPLRHFRRTLGIFEVLSSVPHAFDHTDIITMQFLASMMVAAISRLSSSRPTRP